MATRNYVALPTKADRAPIIIQAASSDEAKRYCKRFGLIYRGRRGGFIPRKVKR